MGAMGLGGGMWTGPVGWGAEMLGQQEGLLCTLTKKVGAEGSVLMEQQLQDFAWGSVQRDHFKRSTRSLSAWRGSITGPVSKKQMGNWDLRST